MNKKLEVLKKFKTMKKNELRKIKGKGERFGFYRPKFPWKIKW